MIVLGIDPGSRITGYGVVQNLGSKQLCIAHGHIATKAATMAERLLEIQNSICHIIEQFKPDTLSIEQVFMHRNVQSALKLGQARGVALASAANYALDIAEYTPRAIKQSIVGYGGADKKQVQHMIQQLLSLKKCPQEDAADALAIALCHCYHHRFLSRVAASDN